MLKISSLLLLMLTGSAIFAQSNEGATLLFKSAKTNLTAAEKNLIYQKTDFKLSKDKKQFITADDANSEFPFDVFVYPTDLNKDGKEEIFIVFGNSFTSGAAGTSVLLFIKDNAGKYQMNLGFPGVTPDVLSTKNPGYPELIIGGPGTEFPVWKWNGKEYVFNRKIKDSQYEKLKPVNVEEASKAYTGNKK